MADFTEAQIRKAIKDAVQEAAPNAIVFSWWCLHPDMNAWPGKLTPTTGNDAGKAHGYVITRRRTDPVRGGDTGRVNPCQVVRGFTYDIIGLHFHDTGKETANSDLEFQAELDAICDKFVATKNLPPALKRSHVPTFSADLRMLGGAIRHFAIGSLVVEQC